METMRIYVACLASYNAGRLHGEWFDLDDWQDADSLYDAVKEQVLLTSPYPNVMVECRACGGDGINPNEADSVCKTCHGSGEVPSAEEWAIHDHEGFPEGSVGEYTSFSRLYEIKERLEEAEEEFGDDGQEILAAFEYCFGDNDASISTIREAYRGKYDRHSDFSMEFAIETSGINEDSPYFMFIDWDHVWQGQDQFAFSEHDGHYFWSDWS